MSAVLGVIPARLGSTRLPRKPLLPIAGRPLIEWVWLNAHETGLFDALVVATDAPEIAAIVEGFGGVAVLTDPGHPSGTDRVAEVARLAPYAEYPVVVNLQGDEPFLPAEVIAGPLRMVRDEGWALATTAVPFASVEEWREPSRVKVVTNDRGGALYFSRAPLPHPREAGPRWESGAYLQHLGLYVFTREALAEWVALPEGALERIERLEQLRPLAAGMAMGVSVAHLHGDGVFGIDTPEDAARAAERLSQRTRTPR
jgi:3-deoxy-manno-octulosonate cytidylyltransferase (CMP-KDO synthetase)